MGVVPGVLPGDELCMSTASFNREVKMNVAFIRRKLYRKSFCVDKKRIPTAFMK